MTTRINNHQKAQPVHKENAKIKYFEFCCELENYLISSSTICDFAEETKFVFNYEEGNPRRVLHQPTDTCLMQQNGEQNTCVHLIIRSDMIPMSTFSVSPFNDASTGC